MMAQDLNFQLYDFSPLRVNPAYAAMDQYMQMDLVYRHQNTQTDYQFTTTNLEVTYPIVNSRRLWSGLAVGVLSDNLKDLDNYDKNQYRIAYALNLPTNKFTNLSFGIMTSFNSLKFNSQGLSTGQQFIEYVGFSSGLPSGEDANNFGNSNYWSFATGINLQKLNRDGSMNSELGVSIYDLNKPKVNWQYSDGQEDIPLNMNLHYRSIIYYNLHIKLSPEALASLSRGNSELMVGGRLQYTPSPFDEKEVHFDIVSRLSTNQDVSLGLQYIRSNMSLALTYHSGLGNRRAINKNTVEFGLSLKRFRPLRKSKVDRLKEKISYDPIYLKKLDPIKPVLFQVENEGELNDILKVEIDKKQFYAKASAGKFNYINHLVETPVYYFNFDFNATQLSPEDRTYLKSIVEILEQNSEVRIEVSGHTDNVGTKEYNRDLSMERANMVASYFRNKGIENRQIKVIASGEDFPLVPNTSDKGRAKNRRVELKIRRY